MSMDKRGDTWRFRIKHKNQVFTMNFKGAEKEAKKAHETFKVDVQNDRIGITEKMNMNMLCELVYKEYVVPNCKVNTQNGYKVSYNNHIIPEFGAMQISDIKPIHIQKFANKLGNKLKPNTISGILGCLSKTLILAEKWELIEHTPYRHIEYKRSTKDNQAELLSLEEIEKLINYYSHKETNLLHKSAFMLAIGCGLRNSEIRALTLDDVDFINGIINIDKQIGEVRNEKGVVEDAVTSTKTPGSVRKLYAPKFVLDCLNQYINSLPYIPTTKQIFWSHITCKPISKHCLSKRFTGLLKELGITQIRFHGLRHLQATLLINGGANVQAVSKRMGHSNLETTLQVYTHSIEAVDKKVADELDATFKNLKSLS